MAGTSAEVVEAGIGGSGMAGDAGWVEVGSKSVAGSV